MKRPRHCCAVVQAALRSTVISPISCCSPCVSQQVPSRLVVEQVTRHLETNAWVIQEFGVANIEVRRMVSRTAEVVVMPEPHRFLA